MKQFIDSLQKLSKQSRLIPPNEIVSKTLIDFESVLTSSPEINAEEIENTILSLLFVNDGNLNCKCSARIAECLCELYELEKSPKLWNVFSIVISKPTTTGLHVISQVIREYGKHSKSMIPGLMKVIYNGKNNDLLSILDVISACFCTVGDELKGFSDKCFGICKNALFSKKVNENEQLVCVDGIKHIIKVGEIPKKKIILLLNEALNMNFSMFVMDAIFDLCAFCAYLPLKQLKESKKEESDWNLNNIKKNTDSNCFLETFEFLNLSKSYSSNIFEHFLDYLPPKFIFENLEIFFKFARKNHISEITQLMSLFGKDVRSELFSEIASEQPPSVEQQQLLRALSYDVVSDQEIAALSLQLTSSDISSYQLCGASYFSLLSEKNLESAILYLKTAALYLASPPQDNPNIENDFHGMALVVSHIIGASPKYRYLISLVSINLKKFIKKALQVKDILSSRHYSVYLVLSVLPSEFVDKEKINESLKSFIKYLEDEQSNRNMPLLKTITWYILSFLASHPNNKQCEYILNLVSRTHEIQSDTAALCSMIAATEISAVPNIYKTYIFPSLLSTTPKSSYILTTIKSPMPLQQCLFHREIFNQKKYETIYTNISSSYMAFHSIEFYPNLVLSIVNEEELIYVITSLVQSTINLLMTHSLILSLIKNVETQLFLPKNLHLILLKTLTNNQKDILRMQVTAECIGKWCCINKNALSETFNYLQKKKDIGKCLCYSSIFANNDLPDKYIISMAQDLNEISKIPDVCSYAQFALSNLYNYSSFRINELFLLGLQLSSLLSLLNMPNLSTPFNLFNMSEAFNKLLPLLSAELSSSPLSSTVKLIIQAFCYSNISFGKQIMFRVMRKVFAFIREFANIKIMKFPIEEGSSISLQITACGAFSDMIKVKNLNHDYFHLIPKLLILLQKRNEKKVFDLIKMIGYQILSQDVSKDRISEWVAIIKSVLSKGLLPNLQIEASIQVKKVCSSISSIIAEKISKNKIILNECLDDLITSETRALEIKDSEILVSAFNFYYNILKWFKDKKTTNNISFLELYEPQFILAVRYGFTSDLNISGNFLYEYLMFQMNKVLIRNEELVSLLKIYFDGISTISERIDIYYQISCELCNIVMLKYNTYDTFYNVVLNFDDCFSEFLRETIKIFEQEKDEPVQYLIYKSTKSQYYQKILISLIWIQSKKQKSFEFLDFIIKEIINPHEKWRIVSAISAFTAILEYYNETIISVSILNEVVSNVKNIYNSNKENLDDCLTKFLEFVSKQKINENENLFENVIYLCLNTTFSYKTIAQIIRTNPQEQYSNLICNKVFELGQSTQKSLSLLTLLIPTSWENELKLLFDSNFDDNYKIKLLTRILKRCTSIKDKEKTISDFLFKQFRKGGMSCLSQVLIENPKIGHEILKYDYRKICILCEKSNQSSTAYLYFLLLYILQCEIDPNEIETILRCALNSILIHGNNQQYGNQIIEISSKIISYINQKYKILQKIFQDFSQADQQVIVQKIEKNISKANATHKNLELMQFSDKVTKNQTDNSDDWETLEII